MTATGRATATAGGAFASRIGPCLLPEGEILDANPRLLRPLPVRMLRNEVAVCVHRVCASGVLPIAILAKLHDADARLRRKLAFRMPLNELPISLDRVGRFRRAPILLLAAAPRHQEQ
jgi:hypothetical protein